MGVLARHIPRSGGTPSFSTNGLEKRFFPMLWSSISTTPDQAIIKSRRGGSAVVDRYSSYPSLKISLRDQSLFMTGGAPEENDIL